LPIGDRLIAIAKSTIDNEFEIRSIKNQKSSSVVFF